ENKVWPLAMTPVQDKYIAIGDSSGQVHLWSISSKTFIATQTVHADGVSSITSFNQFLITGSLDSTIKMWSTEAIDKSGHLRQVGHFNWTSSIEAMGAVQGQEPGEAVIMGGDCTGGVTLLKWK
uniref:TEP-1 C-terminal beta-propeller domain-containing protein n=1 Tax=Amphimedon queenslandica TaxID=400682 RepID=A0A1X7TSA5_AMPQE